MQYAVELVKQCKQLGRLPVVNFAAGASSMSFTHYKIFNAHTHSHTRAHTHTHAHTHAHTHTCVHACTYVRTHTL